MRPASSFSIIQLSNSRSCRIWKKDITTSNEYVDFSYAGIQEKNQYEAVDAVKVHRLAELC